ncbi:ras guanyl-releasing protein 3-like [Petromyzon marinus]|uniref:ras guanyl-releasing protein 3-like n=1 Tax=Petromyzon marinus TaxID=7757 RepID=UPI003F72EAD0
MLSPVRPSGGGLTVDELIQLCLQEIGTQVENQEAAECRRFHGRTKTLEDSSVGANRKQETDESGPMAPHGSSPHVSMLLLLHPWFIASIDFALQLLTLYQDVKGMGATTIRRNICHLVHLWIKETPELFDLDQRLAESMQEFHKVASRIGGLHHASLIDISHIPSCDWLRRVTRRPHPQKRRKMSLLLDHLHALELAELLTFLEYKYFRRVSFADYRSFVVRGSVEGVPALERSISLFNGVSQWVQLMVLSKPLPAQRAQVFRSFLSLAQNLLRLQNFNTLMAVVGALNHSSISRLRDTIAFLQVEDNRVLLELTDLLSVSGNYRSYRQAVSQCEGFWLPVLAVHLKDLVSLHAALPDWLSGERINLAKMQHLHATFSPLMNLHHTPPQIEPNMDLVHLLTVSLDLYYTEEEIYELSVVREPRNGKATRSTPNKLKLSLDWTREAQPKPDPAAINRHIRQMVETVFKNYDHDHDGYIAQEDFQNITANFPFLDSFCFLRRDRIGQVSKEEMMGYFLRANSLRCKLGKGFTHNFQETTYLKPTFCEHCAGFLWGLVKQGFKCKDCGVNCHRQCKELVMECASSGRHGVGATSPSPSLTSLSETPSPDNAPDLCALLKSRKGSDGNESSLTLLTSSAQRISVKVHHSTVNRASQTDHWLSPPPLPKRHRAVDAEEPPALENRLVRYGGRCAHAEQPGSDSAFARGKAVQRLQNSRPRVSEKDSQLDFGALPNRVQPLPKLLLPDAPDAWEISQLCSPESQLQRAGGRTDSCLKYRAEASLRTLVTHTKALQMEERCKKLEGKNAELQEETCRLQMELAAAYKSLASLKHHIQSMCEKSSSFITEQMEILQLDYQD